jgi:hypothetical protein
MEKLMSTKITQITSNTIDTHPHPEACYEWIRTHWHDLGDDHVNEMVDSLKALAEAVSGTLDYSISAVPDRGEYITLKDFDGTALYMLSADACPLTGVCYDQNVITALKNDSIEDVLTDVHNETEYRYSDEALRETCEANEYYFEDSGTIAL